MRFFWQLIALTVMFLVSSAIEGYCFEFANPSSSPQRAKERGTFVAELKFAPDQFDWKGHKFKVHEAWLEGPKNKWRRNPRFMDYVAFCFTFEVDGRYPAEEAGRLQFREGGGMFWYKKLPVHSIQKPPSTEQIELHITEWNAPGFRVTDPPQPGEQQLSVRVIPSCVRLYSLGNNLAPTAKDK